MSPDDPRHGTTAGHAAGCRELCCRRARNDDESRRRKYRQVLGITRSVDATGTSRRIRALMALGWPSREIARHCGWTTGEAVLEISRRGWVQTKTAAAVARVYDELCMTPGPSDSTLRRALAKGWAPPLAWDNIDDPDERPKGLTNGYYPVRSADLVDQIDHARIERIISGSWRMRCTPAEKAEVARRWDRAGRSLIELERLTGWKVERYFRLEDGAA